MSGTSDLPALAAAVHAAVGELEPVYRDLLQALVRIPSPVGSEGAAQALVSDHMRAIGLAVDHVAIDPAALAAHPAFNASPRSYDGRPCVVGCLRAGGAGGRSLILNAHVDTVPVERADDWTHPPFAGVIDGGRLYGRGALDDKAGIVECLLVVDALRHAGVRLAGDLIVKSVIEDESTGNGSLACVERGYTADAVIIVDGTWPGRFIVSHIGQVSFRITLAGRAGHAASSGPNPIAAVGPVIDALRRFVAEKNSTHEHPWGSNPHPTFLNPGRIDGGVWPGSVPAQCVIEGQYGFPPPDSLETAKQELTAIVAAVAQRADWPLDAAPVIAFVGLETPPHLGDPSNPIARLLCETIARLGGETLKESVIVGHCDLRHYTQARIGRTTAACLYGPGGGRSAHGADEYFELAHLPVVARTLASVALAWCGAIDDP